MKLSVKKISTAVLLSAAIVGLSGCGDKDTKSTAQAQTQAQTQSTPAPAKKPIVLKLGYENHPGEPFDLGCNKWKELLEERSGGTMKIELYPSSQLGSKADIIDSMILGEDVSTLADGAFYADRGVKDFGIMFGPFFFDSYEEAFRLADSPWFKEQSRQLEEQGIVIAGANWKYGDRNTLTTKPIRKMEDFKGLKVRVATNEIFSEGMRSLGVTPTPMPLGDVYTSLQQGTIDGVENPVSVLYGGKFQEVAKYLLMDAHIRNITNIVVGTKFMNKLTPEQRQMVLDTCKEAGEYQNKLVDEQEQGFLDKMKAEGVEIIYPDDAFKAQMREAAAKFYELPQFTKIWSENLYQTVKDNCKAK